MRIKYWLTALSMGLLLATGASAQSLTETLSSRVLLGIDRDNGNLVKYDFAQSQQTLVGTLTTSSGTAMTNVRAAAYFPGLNNIYAFWYDSNARTNKLVYVDAINAATSVVNSNVEGGVFTGAASVATASNPYALYAVQIEKVKPPSSITGLININPNNSNDNEFTCTRSNGSSFTRDDLSAKGITLSEEGTYYRGGATFIHVKPKGNGNQNGLIVDSAAFQLKNSNTYDFAGNMQVRVYNDKVSGGKAMGKWWIQIISGEVIINNAVQVLSPNRIALVDQKTGEVTEVMPLSRAYTGLATTDGVNFYTASGTDLYRINTTTLTETKIATTSYTGISDTEFAGGSLIVHDATNRVLAQLNTSTGANVNSSVNYGLGNLGPIMFTPTTQDPTMAARAYD